MPQTKQAKVRPPVELKAIKKKADTIVKKFAPEKIILFGSYGDGNPGPDSDVDLLVIIETKESIWDLAAKISSSVKHTFPMDILVRTPQEIARRLEQGDFFIHDIMEKGKVLYERPC